MKISIITQEDSFVIPKNVELLFKENNVKVVYIYTIDGKGSLTNKLGYFIKGFGFLQSAQMGIHLISAKLLDCIDRLFGGRLPLEKRSIKAVAKKYRVPYGVLQSLRIEETLNELRSQNLDLIISFSAPCIFPPALLEIPKQGCLNLHCSLLPSYAGVLPSFWTMYHGETEGGATVHYMDDKIDNGSILGQVRVNISDCRSMYQSIRKTKRAGGELMIDVIRRIINGSIQVTPNDISRGSYFTWPTIEQMHDFCKKGGRLI
jgi:methionyl-tRNA formyltransferase